LLITRNGAATSLKKKKSEFYALNIFRRRQLPRAIHSLPSCIDKTARRSGKADSRSAHRKIRTAIAAAHSPAATAAAPRAGKISQYLFILLILPSSILLQQRDSAPATYSFEICG
jgi:hypothetical protein